MRLITIPISHYCERARWALDHAGLPYTEEQHLQGFSRRVTKKVGATTVPVLHTEHETLADSGEIVAWADARAPDDRKLYPENSRERADVVALETRFAGRLGIESRRWAYHRLLPLKPLLLRYNRAHAPWAQHVALRFGYPFAKAFVTRYLRIYDDRVDRGLAHVETVMDDVAQHLGDGRPYLTGDRFTAADLTFSALVAPLLLPADYGVPLPRPEELPPAVAQEIASFRAHPAGQFALRIYADHRR